MSDIPAMLADYPLSRQLDGDLWLTVQPITFGRWRVSVCTPITNNVEAY